MSLNPSDILQFLSEPQVWPMFLTFLGGYVMMRILIKKGKTDSFSDLDKILIAFGVGFLFEFFLFYPLTTLAVFWWLPLRDSSYLISVFLFCTVSAVLLLLRVNRENEVAITKLIWSALGALVTSLAVFAVFVSVIGIVAMSRYEPYILATITSGWKAYVGLTVVSVFFVVGGVFFIWAYLYKPLLKEPLEARLQFTKRVLVIGLVTLLVSSSMAALIVHADTQVHFFTPRMETRNESFSKQQPGGYAVALFLYVEKITRTRISTTSQLYGLMDKTYTVSRPWVPLVTSVYIQNPSNTSFLKGDGQPSVGTGEGWKKVYAYTPANVTYEFDMSQLSSVGTEVQGLVVSFSNFSGASSFNFNITYWQEIPLLAGISVEYSSPSYLDLGNQTWTEEYSVKIKNNSNYTLMVPALDLNCFAYQSTDRNSTKAYRNGQLIEYAELVSLTSISLWQYIYPNYEADIMVSFETSNID